MRRSCVLFVLAALSFAFALTAHAQDDESPSLADVARQSRQAKQQRESQTGTASASQSPKNLNTAPPQDDTASQSSNATPSKTPSVSGQKKPATTVARKNTPDGNSAKRVLTNEDMGASNIAREPESTSRASTADPSGAEPTGGKNPPEYWSARILSQKNAIASLKSDIDQLSASIQYAPGNCVEGCVEWNQHQQEKQQQVDSMKAQLEDMQKQLEDMQEGARKQGYGSSVYEP